MDELRARETYSDRAGVVPSNEEHPTATRSMRDSEAAILVRCCCYRAESHTTMLNTERVSAHAVFYLGLGFLFTHELDAMTNHEWRILPGLAALPDSTGELAFVLAHVPLFAIVIAFVASLNRKVRGQARAVASGFLVLHALLHRLFSSQDAYEFTSTLSSFLIYGAAVCGAAYLLVAFLDRNSDAADPSGRTEPTHSEP